MRLEESDRAWILLVDSDFGRGFDSRRLHHLTRLLSIVYSEFFRRVWLACVIFPHLQDIVAVIVESQKMTLRFFRLRGSR